MSPPRDSSALSSAEKDALIASLFARVDELLGRVDDLSQRLATVEAENAALREKLDLPPKTPENSSTPPSQGRKASSEAIPKPKAKPHAGAHRPLHPNPTSHRQVPAANCQHCGNDVTGAPQSVCEVYDRIEIPEIKPDVTRVSLLGGVCPCCTKRFKAEPPQGLEPGSPFGPNLRALALYLRFTQAVGFERLSQLFSDLLGVDISEGALVNILADSRDAFARQTSLIRARLLAGTILQSDETSVRVGKQTWWIWVFHHADSAYFIIHPNRSRAVVEGFLGTYRPDYWVSDRLAAQMRWAKKDHQVCLAHLIRDATYAIEAGDTAFAPALRKLLQRACAIAGRRPELTDATLRSYRYKLNAELDAVMRITPTHAAGQKLHNAITGCRRFLFVFLADRAIPPTNNGSEQALRPCVTFRKVTNCFRSQWGANLYADVRSVIETARRRAIGALQAIRLTLNGTPLPVPEPQPSG
jgi:transposase